MLGRILAQQPDSVVGLTLLSRALLALGRPADAATAGQQAVAADPSSLDARLALCDAQVHLDDADGARGTAGQLVRDAPEHWIAHYAQARALLTGRRPRTREALESARVSVGLAPHQAPAHHLLGICFEALGDERQADLAFHEALRLDPAHTGAQGSLADLDLRHGRLGQASGKLSSALSQAPSHAGLHDSLDSLWFRLVRRIWWAILVAALLTGIALSTGAAYPVRAVLGIAMLGAVGWLTYRSQQLMPGGVALFGRDVFRRVGLMAKALQAVTAVSIPAVALIAFAPHHVASAAGLAMLTLLRLFGLLVLVTLVIRAGLMLVRR